MVDLGKARACIQSILNLPTANREAKYYAEVALSHLQPERDENERLNSAGNESPRRQNDREPDRDTRDRVARGSI